VLLFHHEPLLQTEILAQAPLRSALQGRDLVVYPEKQYCHKGAGEQDFRSRAKALEDIVSLDSASFEGT
jgi:hypothetical protein